MSFTFMWRCFSNHWIFKHIKKKFLNQTTILKKRKLHLTVIKFPRLFLSSFPSENKTIKMWHLSLERARWEWGTQFLKWLGSQFNKSTSRKISIYSQTATRQIHTHIKMQQKNLWEKLIVSWWWAAKDRWDNVMRLEKRKKKY